MSKSRGKKKKTKADAYRVWVPFNTGTREHATDKHPSRARRKELERDDD